MSMWKIYTIKYCSSFLSEWSPKFPDLISIILNLSAIKSYIYFFMNTCQITPS